MKKILRHPLFFIVIALIIIIGLIIISNRTVDGSKGGILEGPSHKQGGIKAIIKSNNKMVELEGNEDILTKRINEIETIYNCSGTPAGIASALNVEAGGVKFNDGGKCWIK